MDEVSSHPVELSNLCRICVERSTNLINLFEKWQNGLTLAKMLSDCIQKSVHQSDGRPTNICLTCVSSLVSAFEFFVVERDSEDKLKRLLGTSTIPAVKQEPEPEEEQYNEQVIPMDFVISDFGPIDCKNEDSFDGSTLFDADDGENSFQDDAGPSRTKKNGIKSKPKRGKQPKMKDKPVQKEPMKTKTKKKKRSKSSSPSHWRLARDSKQFECYKCKIVLPLFSKIRAHLNKHDNIERPHLCSECGMGFQRPWELKSHEARHKSSRKVTCKDCGAQFYNNSELRSHSRAHSDERPYICDINDCGKGFKWSSDLKKHKLRHSTFKPVECTLCFKRFYTKDELTKHLKTHMDEKPYLCSECGTGFKTKPNLTSHMVSHFKVYSFPCPKCPAKFVNNSRLKRHMLGHDDQKHMCEFCNEILSTVDTLRKHKRTIHGTAGKIKCEISACGMEFTTKTHLKTHMRRHTGEKPYTCDYCSRAFRQKGVLNTHLRLHIGEFTYKCELCPEAFRLKVDLRQHQEEHYKDTERSLP